MKPVWRISCFFLFFLTSVFSKELSNQLKLREMVQNLKTSIVIPCYPGHFHLLYPLLRHLSAQTIPPDEVVISLSGVEHIQQEEIEKLKTSYFPFCLKLLKNEGIVLAGTNRNRAFENTTGDIIIYQDADDLPHPQRVEIIKHFFERYHIDLILHHYVSIDVPESQFLLSRYDVGTLQVAKCSTYEEADRHSPFSNGVNAVSREVAQTIKWDSDRQGEDIKFNKKVFQQFEQALVIKHPLILWRVNFSSSYDN